MDKKITQKSLDLEVADRLDYYASKLSGGTDIKEGRLSYEEYLNILSALRYAISRLRGGSDNDSK